MLARLLVPADFGLVAMATALSGALAAMSEFGFAVALIQNQTADRRYYDTAWTLGLIRGLLVAGALAACADPLATMFADQRLEPILHVLAVGLVITSFENIAVVDFRKDLQFHREFYYRALAKIASFAFTVSLAVLLRNYWALVSGIVVGQLAGVRPQLHDVRVPTAPRPVRLAPAPAILEVAPPQQHSVLRSWSRARLRDRQVRRRTPARPVRHGP